MSSSFLYHVNHAPFWRGEIDVWGHRMRGASLDRLLYLGLHRSGWMGKNEGQLLRTLVRPGMRTVDVGANVGLYSLFLAHLAGKEGSVLSFEPEPNLFATLVANCARNAAHNVTPFQRALGRENRRTSFQRSAFNSGDNRTGPRAGTHEPLEVELVRFDDLQPRSALDFIKIDVQGHELDVLCGMEDAIAASPAVGVLFEFCPSAIRHAGGSPEELLGFFRERDFLLYQTVGGKLELVHDSAHLIASVSGNRYLNLFASRSAVELDD